MITEARVEYFMMGLQAWMRGFSEGKKLEGTIPHMLEAGRQYRRRELESRRPPGPAPVRVVDSSGAVVAQWGKP